MKTRVDAAPAPSYFGSFLSLFLITLAAAFFFMFSNIQVSHTILPARSPATAQTSPADLFRGLIRVPTLRFSSPSVEEIGMSPKALLDRWQPFIQEASQRFAIPENWIRTVIKIESGGRTMLFGRPITSGAGAMGVMQLMPETYDEMRARHGLGPDPFNAHDNILAGTAYLRELYARYGYPHFYAAYNAGPGRLEDYLHKKHALPAETRAYVRLATDGEVDASFGEMKPAKTSTKLAAKNTRLASLKGGKSEAKSAKGKSTRVAAVYQPAS